MLKPEGHHVYRHVHLGRAAAEEPCQLPPEAAGGIGGGVDHEVRPLPHGGHQGHLPPHRLLNGAIRIIEGMPTPGLLVPLDQGVHRRLQKQQPAGNRPLPQGIQHPEELLKILPGPHIIDQGRPIIAALGPGTELGKLQNNPSGHIVHNIVAHILQKGGRLTLPPAGQPGDNQDLQKITPLFFKSGMRN